MRYRVTEERDGKYYAWRRGWFGWHPVLSRLISRRIIAERAQHIGRSTLKEAKADCLAEVERAARKTREPRVAWEGEISE